jgi:hypothetical protein
MSIFKEDIGVGLITCNRPEFFNNLLNSIDTDYLSEILIFNSGTEPIEYNKDKFSLVSKEINKETLSVGHAKNELLRFLRNKNKKHIFLIEDDMLLKDNSIFERYIKHAYTSGIYHFNFHKHGNANVNSDGSSIIINSVDYECMDEKYEITFHPNILGSFSYYNSAIIPIVGYIDENFVNAMEHVEHSYRIFKNGFSTGFGWWADIANSDQYIGEQDENHSCSIIRKDKEKFLQNFKDALLLFEKKHGFNPTQAKPMGIEEVLNFLEKMHSTNGNMLEKIYYK